jgi:Zn-dependent M28 family amino/carboxypeptidase
MEVLYRILRRGLFLLAWVFLSLFLLWGWVTQPVMGKQGERSEAPVNPSRLQTHVRMLSETFFPRDAGTPDNLDRAAVYIRRQLAEAGGEMSEQPFPIGNFTYRNVVARFGASTTDCIVVGAHYDAAGKLPAADDNASGVAGLIELAFLLGKNPPPACVELVAFTLEEQPFFGTALMGSTVHAQSLKARGLTARVMFSLEMIGYFTDAPHSQRYPFPLLAAAYPTQGNFVAVVGNFLQGPTVRRVKQAMQSASPLPVYSINAPRIVPGIDLSDHASYWDEGYKAVMITDTAFYRNPNYHTRNDTPDTLDYQRMAHVVQGVYAAVRAFL